jgi:predicted nucleotidyltransferase
MVASVAVGNFCVGRATLLALQSLIFQNNLLKLGIIKNTLFLCSERVKTMKTRQEYLKLLQGSTERLRTHFGVKSMCLFGSVARDEHTEASDVDICVEMAPDLYRVVELKQYLEQLLDCSVDVIRRHRGMNLFLQQQIDKDGINVFGS